MRTPLPAARQAVVGRAARDGVHQVLAAQRLHRRHALFGQPGVQTSENALAHQRRRCSTPPLNSTCVGQARPLGPRRTAPCSAAGRLLPQEARQVPRDGGVGRVGQADLLQAHAALPRAAYRVLGTAGRKPSRRMRSMSARCSLALMVPPTSPVPLPRMVTGCSSALAIRDRAASPWPRGSCAHSAWSCRLSMRVPFSASRCATMPRQREVDVVAAQQDVLAHGDAVERQFAVLLR